MNNDLKNSVMNQSTYDDLAHEHSKIGIDSTIYLAYRDLPNIIKKHFTNLSNKQKINILDYGCGAGSSTEMLMQICNNLDLQIDVFGVDVNAENIQFAQKRIPQGKFYLAPAWADYANQFYIILCNFVLLENRPAEIKSILQNIRAGLSPNGIAIITNCTADVYDRTKHWHSFTSDFEENTTPLIDGQKVKTQIEDKFSGASFTFCDFFYYPETYEKLYTAENLTLLESHLPLGKESDNKTWKAEKEFAPYKIDVLKQK